MKKGTAFHLLVFFGLVLIDQISKYLGQGLDSLTWNEGFIFGLYSEIPKALRVTTLCSFFGFLFFCYLVMTYLLPKKMAILQWGLTIFISGIGGNVLDRTFYGKTRDFIPTNWISLDFVFNIADVYQWIGVGIILFMAFRREKILWHPENVRVRYLILPKEQLRLSLKFAAVSLSMSLVLGLFGFSFLREMVITGPYARITNKIMLNYALSYFALTLTFTALVFAVGILISHKTAGPLYAFERFVERLLEGDPTPLQLREGDHYRRLETMADKLRKEFFKRTGS